jgi:hypothetical protein
MPKMASCKMETRITYTSASSRIAGANLVTQAEAPRQSRARGRHRKQASRRWVWDSKRISFRATAALLVALAFLIGALVKSATEAPGPTTEVAQPPADIASGLAASPTSEPSPAPTPVMSGTDDKGFVDSGARCGGAQTPVALGRTERSNVVICGDQTGRYEYRGVRLSDDALLKAAAETTPAHGFLARNSGVLYSVSPTELRVTTGETVIKQEAMLEFQGSTAITPRARARSGR